MLNSRKKTKKAESPKIQKNKNKKWYHQHWFDILFVIVLCLILTFIFPKGKSYQFGDLKEGSVYVGEEVIAPFTFSVNKSDEEYAADIEEARKSVKPVFEYKSKVEEAQLDRIASFAEHMKTLLKNPTTEAVDIKSVLNDAGIVLSDSDIEALLTGFERGATPGSERTINQRLQSFNQLVETVKPLVKKRYTAGIIDRLKREFAESRNRISIRKQGDELVEKLEYYHDINEASNALLEDLRESGRLSEGKIKEAYSIGSAFLQPNLVYNETETELRRKEAVASVPLAKDQVLAGERIIDSHQRLTRQHIEKLRSLAQAKAERGEMHGLWQKLKPALGRYLLVLTILSLFFIFLWKDNRELLLHIKERLLIALTILIVSIFIYLSNRFTLSPYVIPVSTLAIVVTVFFNVRVGFWSVIVMSLLTGALRGSEYSITFVSLFTSSIAVLSVSRVRNRNWILRSGLMIAAAYLISITIIDFVGYSDFKEIAQDWGFGILNGFLSPGLAYIVIIVFESVFDKTTDMTLLELSDFNHPLLRRLSLEAPGTYHHSYLIGMLAESATEALGGNALLARVGSYYHDIGKLEKPEYFVENQTKGRNPQEKLSPRMSSLILSNHVRRGLDMAREYGLPKEIEAFINQHHGTSMMNFFYQKELEQKDAKDVSESEFRYPGPRPQTVETAIVMLADSVEAASRTLKDPKPNRIKNLVEQIIDERFKSGELDEAPLNLKNLSKISAAFQKILNGIFHGRIEYPNQPEEDKDEKQDDA